MGRLTVATDDFNRGDSASLGSNWSDGPQSIINGTHPNISGNAAANGNTTIDNDAFYSGATFTSNQWAEATISAIDAGVNSFSGVIVRGTATDFIVGQMDKPGGQYIITWYNGALYTSLGTLAVTPAVGHKIALVVVDTTFYFFLNDTMRLKVTNASVPTTGSPGLVVSGSTLNADKLDNWSGGNYVQPNLYKLGTRPAPFKPGISR